MFENCFLRGLGNAYANILWKERANEKTTMSFLPVPFRIICALYEADANARAGLWKPGRAAAYIGGASIPEGI